MLGTPRLLTFALRAIVLIMLISILWVSVARPYDEALVFLAQPLVPDSISMKALGSHIIIDDSRLSLPLSIDGLTLHFGLILMAALVLAAVGIGVAPRLGWLAAMGAGAFLMHVIGVALIARGLTWASVADSPDDSRRLVLSAFAVFWGLIPALIGGLWCFMYWLPRVSNASQNGQQAENAPDVSASS